VDGPRNRGFTVSSFSIFPPEITTTAVSCALKQNLRWAAQPSPRSAHDNGARQNHRPHFFANQYKLSTNLFTIGVIDPFPRT
jgi:hypothetical protein